MEQLDVRYKTDYGATELRKLSRKHLALALLIAMAFHFLGVGAYWGTVYLTREDVRAIPRVPSKPIYEIVLPTLTQAIAPTLGSQPRPRAGVPVPVAGERVDSNATIPTQWEMNQEPATIDGGPVPGGGVAIQQEDNEPPPPFVVYERPPEAVKRVQPKYPDLAARAGLEGTVWVKIWVDKEGKPRRALVVKTEAEIFNQPATEAAMQWAFTPAMMKSGPVSVWVSIPFHFKLQRK